MEESSANITMRDHAPMMEVMETTHIHVRFVAGRVVSQLTQRLNALLKSEILPNQLQGTNRGGDNHLDLRTQ